MTYNAKTNRIRPADRNFRNFTFLIILTPAVYTLVGIIAFNDQYNLLEKILVGLSYFILFFSTVFKLIQISVTDPGILPSVN